MTITFACERMADVLDEFKTIIPLHWMEIARDREIIKLDPDWDSYLLLESVGGLHMMVARADGRMIGYHLSFIRPHLHYRGSLTAITDIYFLLPQFRKGRTGIDLFQAVEKSWKARGVQKAYSGCKVAQDKTLLFERLGWKWIEKTFTKVL